MPERKIYGGLDSNRDRRSLIDLTNSVGNVLNLGTIILVDEFTAWMFPRPWNANPPSFEYPGNRLLKFSGTISDGEMWKPSLMILEHNNHLCIMVMKRGNASDINVGCLNTIRSLTRVYFKGRDSQMSKEVVVSPRNSNPGAFSKPGDSGSAVIERRGGLAGLLTGGARVAEVSDCF